MNRAGFLQNGGSILLRTPASRYPALAISINNKGVTVKNYWPARGGKEIKERVEIDPKQLQEAPGSGCDFFYRLEMTIPKVEGN